MEVHHHTHTARQKFLHYFWEFFMLFLAVTLGFFVENQREHMVEHKRENQYMQSMVEDLNADTMKLAIIVRDHKNVLEGLAYIMDHFEEFVSGQFPPSFFGSQFSKSLNGYSDFQYTDRTIDQLKNSGGMRLIRKQDASDSIVSYNDDVRDFLLEQESLSKVFEKTGTALYELYNFRLLRQALIKSSQNPEKKLTIKSSDLLLTHDKQKIEGFYNLLDVYRGTLEGKLQAAGLLKEKATRLISFLRYKYNLH
jgi:hypothetical protein